MRPVEPVGAGTLTCRVEGVEIADPASRPQQEAKALADMGLSERASVFQDLLDEMGIGDGRPVPVRLDFRIHKPTGRLVVDVTNRETGELLKSLPPENLLNALTRMMEFIGLVMDERI